MSTHAVVGHTGISGARVVVVAFAEDDLVEVLAFIVQAA